MEICGKCSERIMWGSCGCVSTSTKDRKRKNKSKHFQRGYMAALAAILQAHGRVNEDTHMLWLSDKSEGIDMHNADPEDLEIIKKHYG